MAVGAGDIVRVDARFSYDGLTAIQNVFHLRNDGASQDEADVIDDMVEVIEGLYTLLAAILQLAMVLNDLRIINVTDNSDVGFGTFVDTTPGTGTQTIVPQNSFGLILDTARLASKGRKFFGPVGPSNYSPGGLIGAGALADMADAGDEMIVAQVATNSTWRYGIMSTLEGVGFLPFTNYGVSPSVVTQRRRRIGVGI